MFPTSRNNECNNQVLNYTLIRDTLYNYVCFVRNNIQNGMILNHWDDKLLHKLFPNIIYGLMKHKCHLISSFIYVSNSQLWIKIAVSCQKTKYEVLWCLKTKSLRNRASAEYSLGLFGPKGSFVIAFQILSK